MAAAQVEEAAALNEADGWEKSGGERLHGKLGALTFDLTVESRGSSTPRLARLCAPLKQILSDYLGIAVAPKDSFSAVRSVGGFIMPRQTCLLLGPPGCGKSTLLRALAGNLHAKAERLEGRVCLGGVQLDTADPLMRRLVNYVGSSDMAHSPVLTVNETFTFASACALPYDKERVASSVERMEQVLGLTHVRDTVVGGEELRGISGGQKRRVSFGEMVFATEAPFAMLDDVTNGLDSYSAANLVRAVREACFTYGFGAMVTLLQPPQEVFELFDSLLCLTSDGRAAYFGPRGQACPYFEQVAGLKKPAEKSEPEFIQEVLSKSVSADMLSATYAQSSAYQEMSREMAELNRERRRESLAAGLELRPSRYANGRWTQFRLCTWRRSLLVLRNAMTVRRPIVAILFGLVTGTLFWDLPNDLVGTISKSGYTFLSLFLVLMLSAAVTLPENYRQRPVFFKHRGANLYATLPYYLSTVLLDIPLALLEAALLAGVPYYMVGMRKGVSHFFYFWAVLLGLEFVGQAWGRFVSAVCPTEVMANVVTTAYIFVCGLISGYMPGYRGVGWWWRWLSWVTPVSYGFEGLMINEYAGRDVNLLVVVDATDGTTEIGSVPGSTLISTLFSLPRVPYSDAPGSMNTPANMKAFDLAMIFAFSVVLDLAALALLDVSRRRFGAQTRRLQVYVGKNHGKDHAKTAAPKKPEAVGEAYPPHDKDAFDEKRAPDAEAEVAAAAAAAPAAAAAEAALGSEGMPAGLSPVLLTVEDLTYDVRAPKSDGKEAAAAAAAAAGAAATASGISAKGDPEAPAAPAFDNSMDARAGEHAAGNEAAKSEKTAEFHDRSEGPISFEAEEFDVQDSLRRCEQTTSTYGQNERFSFVRAASSLLVGRSAAAAAASGSSVSRVSRASAVPEAAAAAAAADYGGEGGVLEAEEKAPPGKLRLLTRVTAAFKGGEMTALMGESGAGKTTLLDVIAGYKTGGQITGKININGHLKDGAVWKLLSGYCEQCDIHNPYLSVWESLLFAAHCRLPAATPGAEKTRAVLRVAELLGIEEYLGMLVGREGAGEGLPKHARKRLTIAVELVAGPRILFLDEPTTGLDAVSADIVLSSVRRSADVLNLAVLATIHQPSRALFELFDNLLLLKKGGRVVYSGAIHGEGRKSGCAELVRYFEGLHPSFRMGEAENPADFALQVVEGKRTPGVTVETTNPRGAYLSSKLCTTAASLVQSARENPTDLPPTGKRPGFAKQVQLLWKRQALALWRNGSYTATRFVWTFFGALMVGTVFLNLGDDLISAVLSIGAIFFAVYVAVVPMQAAVVPLMEERAVLYRETSSGTYSHWAYSLGQLLADIPFHLASATVFFVTFYFLVGLRGGASHAGYFLLVMLVGYWLLPSIGQLMALLSPNAETANGLAGLCIILSTLLMGFLMPYALMPSGWQWANWVNCLRYILQGLCVNELANRYFPLDLSAVLSSVQISAASPIVVFPSGGANLAEMGSYLGGVLQNVVNSTVAGFTDDFAAAENENLLACLIANDCLVDKETINACVQPGVFNSGPCFSVALALATSIPSLLSCFGDGVKAALTCLFPYIVPTSVVERAAAVARAVAVALIALKGAASWLINVKENFSLEGLSLPSIPVPGNVILASFGWAEANVDAGPTGQNVTLSVLGTDYSFPGYAMDINWVTNTRYWYCFFSIVMFLVGIEALKVLAARYVCFIKR